MSGNRKSRRAASRQQPGKSEYYLEHAEYNGPVPMPEDLQKYEDIQPGFAERLITMAEQEQKWRHGLMEKQQTSTTTWNSKQQNIQILGQILGLISVLLVISLCGYAFYLGFDQSAKWIAVSVIVSLASVFVLNQYKKDS